MKKKINGYSLIEILVVFTIIGIIIGSILSIKYSFRETKIKKTISEINKITRAVKTFKNNYGDLPGDINNTINKKISNINTDGNNDGVINLFLQTENNKNTNVADESIYFWTHLYNTNLLARDKNESIFKKIYLNQNTYYSIFSHNKKNYLHLGSIKSDGDVFLKYINTLQPLEAFIIDEKIDDGLPNRGKASAVIGDKIEDFFKEKTDMSCSFNFDYNIKNQDKVCQLMINID